MKTKAINLMLLAASLVVLCGCISIPPLIKVESTTEGNPSTSEVLRRLDSIDRRIDQLEKKLNEPTDSRRR